MTVLFFARAVLERAQTAKLALDGNAEAVGDVDDLSGDGHVVFVARRRLAVVFQRTIHHDAGKSIANGAHAGVGGVAVILVHDDGKLGIELRSGKHQVAQEGVVRVLARASRGLHDDRAFRGAGGLHDGLDLFHVVDVQGGHAVVVGGGVVEKGTKWNQRHDKGSNAWVGWWGHTSTRAARLDAETVERDAARPRISLAVGAASPSDIPPGVHRETQVG